MKSTRTTEEVVKERDHETPEATDDTQSMPQW